MSLLQILMVDELTSRCLFVRCDVGLILKWGLLSKLDALELFWEVNLKFSCRPNSFVTQFSVCETK